MAILDSTLVLNSLGNGNIMVPFYYVRTQEKCEISLASLFNNLTVNKYTDIARKDVASTVRVPIVINYDKNFANWYSNTNTQRRPMPLPIAGLRFVSKSANDANRTQPTYSREIYSTASERWIKDVQPTPYFLRYSLDILSDNLSDFHQINENIIPYFNTFRTMRINEFDFEPTFERKILVYLESVTDTLDDELSQDSKHRIYKSTFNFRLDVDFYRPFEIPEMIKYAELNLSVGDIVHSMQTFVYPDPIAQQEKKKWETLAPSIRDGFTLLKTSARTLIINQTIDGNHEWVDVTVPDAARPAMVPVFDLLHLNFDTDSALADDSSGFNRDFTAIDDSTRQFLPNMEPDGGQIVETGYKVGDAVQWNRILDWFGTANGENESPFTFQITIQFRTAPITDTVFQTLSNIQTIASDGSIIPAGEVFFDWGIIDSKLYFTIKTYGSKAIFHTFRTINSIDFNATDMYKISFVLYNKGYDGMFGYSVNDGSTIALLTETI